MEVMRRRQKRGRDEDNKVERGGKRECQVKEKDVREEDRGKKSGASSSDVLCVR